jgi:hypothetical protein
MPSPRKAPPKQLPEALALRRRIPVPEAAAILDIHEDTFRKHYPDLITRVGPRLERVELGTVLAIGQPKR